METERDEKKSLRKKKNHVFLATKLETFETIDKSTSFSAEVATIPAVNSEMRKITLDLSFSRSFFLLNNSIMNSLFEIFDEIGETEKKSHEP